MKLLEQMKRYMTTKQCRRQILLEYFDEEYDDKCDFCDNCTGVHKVEEPIVATEQNVQTETKLLIDLIESIETRSFGAGMYINILRGSGNKNITSYEKKVNFMEKENIDQQLGGKN